MDIPQILDYVDEAVWAKTGEHLNDLQRRIIAGILQRQTYAEVAQNNRYSEKHVKKASHQLLQMLSDVFGEHVKKSNLESVLERQINVNITFGNKNNPKNIISIGSINNCPDPSPATPDKSQPATPDGQQDSNNHINIETIDKLRGFGLRDEQIAEALGLPLEVVEEI
ncbi:MAG: hypothetical protein AB4352_04745 [Hormoscilla sp.]